MVSRQEATSILAFDTSSQLLQPYRTENPILLKRKYSNYLFTCLLLRLMTAAMSDANSGTVGASNVTLN